MMNYIIWNGNDSREIKGLIICELPPITKPLMRTAETIIDGVDGSVIEELGYGSYDKALTIGLTRNADIDEVVSYFSGHGEVVFSNEADKYYKASIIGQIDYARLVRFRTATVVFRVQPFKYEYLEKEQDLLQESVSGKTVTLTDRELVSISIEGTSGETAEIQRTGKNLLSSFVKGQKLDPVKGSVGNDGTGATTDYIRVDYEANDCYFLSGLSTTLRTFVGAYNENKEFLGRSGANPLATFELGANVYTAGTPQATGDIAYLRVTTYKNTDDSDINIIDTLNVQLEIGTRATAFEEYNGNTEVIELTGNQTIVPSGQLQKLLLQDGVNIISSNKNMVINHVDNKLLVNNVGNYIAKPIMEIKGSGEIVLEVNGNTLFRYTFPDGEDTVVIDSQKQDAYLGSILKNRNMSGEFPTFEIGTNTITWNGIISSIKISAKSRWL